MPLSYTKWPKPAARCSRQKFPGANVQAFPHTDAAQLELHAVPDDRRIAEAGWDRATLGDIVRTLGDGSWLGEYFDGEQRVPVILRAGGGQTPEELAQTPLVTPSGQVDSARRPGQARNRARSERRSAASITAAR